MDKSCLKRRYVNYLIETISDNKNYANIVKGYMW